MTLPGAINRHNLGRHERSLQPFMAGLDPLGVVLLGDYNRGVTKQLGNLFKLHPPVEAVHREAVSETVRVSARNIGHHGNLFQPSPEGVIGLLEGLVAVPERASATHPRNTPDLLDQGPLQVAGDGPVILELPGVVPPAPLPRSLDHGRIKPQCVTDAEPGLMQETKQDRECLWMPGKFGASGLGPQDAGDRCDKAFNLLGFKGHNVILGIWDRLHVRRGVVRNPSTAAGDGEENPQAVEMQLPGSDGVSTPGLLKPLQPVGVEVLEAEDVVIRGEPDEQIADLPIVAHRPRLQSLRLPVGQPLSNGLFNGVVFWAAARNKLPLYRALLLFGVAPCVDLEGPARDYGAIEAAAEPDCAPATLPGVDAFGRDSLGFERGETLGFVPAEQFQHWQDGTPTVRGDASETVSLCYNSTYKPTRLLAYIRILQVMECVSYDKQTTNETTKTKGNADPMYVYGTWRGCVHGGVSAYDRAAIELHGEFARTNFPRSDYD